MKFFNITVVGIMLLSVTFLGCASETKRNLPVGFVEGTVTMDGAPLGDASVQFIPKTEGSGIEPAGGHTDAAGKFTLTSMNGDPGAGALPGDYDVFISKTVSELIPGAKVVEGDEPPTETKQVTPEIYRDRKKPVLEATVVKGKNTFSFDLKSKP